MCGLRCCLHCSCHLSPCELRLAPQSRNPPYDLRCIAYQHAASSSAAHHCSTDRPRDRCFADCARFGRVAAPRIPSHSALHSSLAAPSVHYVISPKPDKNYVCFFAPTASLNSMIFQELTATSGTTFRLELETCRAQQHEDEPAHHSRTYRPRHFAAPDSAVRCSACRHPVPPFMNDAARYPNKKTYCCVSPSLLLRVCFLF